jgi:hypothetical protein
MGILLSINTHVEMDETDREGHPRNSQKNGDQTVAASFARHRKNAQYSLRDTI